MGAPVIVGVLGALGLSWLRQDAILWPMMFGSLAIAYWGLWDDRRRHGAVGPLVAGLLGGASLIAGVVFVHGHPARLLIYAGSIALLSSAAWNVLLRRAARRVALADGRV